MEKVSAPVKKLSLLILTTAFALLLTACGSSSQPADSSFDEYIVEAPAAHSGGTFYGMSSLSNFLFSDKESVFDDYDMPEPESYRASSLSSVSENSAASVPAQPKKLIRTAEMRLESTEFDTAAEALNALVEEFNGYFSYANTSGSTYRMADYTVRIPEQHFTAFLDRAGTLAHETSRSVSQDDVSEFYYDTQGRLRTQTIKLERLQTLLEQAEAVEDIITIESAISETEERIEELSGTLRHYDDMVDYATVEISLYEVYRLSNVETPPESYISRLGKAFSDGLREFGEGLEDFTISLAYGWVWVVILAVCALIAVKLIRSNILRLRNQAESRFPVSSDGKTQIPDGETQKSPDSVPQDKQS